MPKVFTHSINIVLFLVNFAIYVHTLFPKQKLFSINILLSLPWLQKECCGPREKVEVSNTSITSQRKKGWNGTLNFSLNDQEDFFF